MCDGRQIHTHHPPLMPLHFSTWPADALPTPNHRQSFGQHHSRCPNHPPGEARSGSQHVTTAVHDRPTTVHIVILIVAPGIQHVGFTSGRGQGCRKQKGATRSGCPQRARQTSKRGHGASLWASMQLRAEEACHDSRINWAAVRTACHLSSRTHWMSNVQLRAPAPGGGRRYSSVMPRHVSPPLLVAQVRSTAVSLGAGRRAAAQRGSRWGGKVISGFSLILEELGPRAAAETQCLRAEWASFPSYQSRARLMADKEERARSGLRVPVCPPAPISSRLRR